MAQFTPSKKTIKDFNDGEEYLNRIDVVQADTVNNLVEGLLYAQENGGTTVLTEGREFGKTLNVNDYYIALLPQSSNTSLQSKIISLPTTAVSPTINIIKNGTPKNNLKITSKQEIKQRTLVLSGYKSRGLKITKTHNTLSITKETNNQYQNKLKIGE